MSQENVETFKRWLAAYNRRDLDALMEELHPVVEWQPALAMLLGGERTVFRGHQGVREWIQEVDKAVAELQFEVSEIRDLGNSVLSIGRTRVLKRESRVPIETDFFALANYRDGKAIRLRTYFHLTEALEAAGLRE